MAVSRYYRHHRIGICDTPPNLIINIAYSKTNNNEQELRAIINLLKDQLKRSDNFVYMLICFLVLRSIPCIISKFLLRKKLVISFYIIHFSLNAIRKQGNLNSLLVQNFSRH